MKKVYVVDLTKEEKSELLKLVGKGEARARKMNRAHILLLAEEGRTDKDISEALHTSPSTVERTRRRFVEEGGLEHALNESPRPGGRRKLDGHQEAYLMALACSDPPEGKSAGVCRCSLTGSWSSKWSMRSPMKRSDARSKRGR